jgi:hypothetical protein
MTTYRVSTVGRASALSGNATLAILNKAASGRRLAIKNIEIHPLTTYTTTRDRIIRLGRTTSYSNGRTVTPDPYDTTSAVADLTVGLAGSVAALTEVFRTINTANRDGPSFALGHLVKNGAPGRLGARSRFAGTWRGESSARERIIISPGETVAAVMHLTHEPLFGYVTAEFRNTTTGKHYHIMEWTYALTESQALFTATNTDGTEDYELVSFDFQVVGTVTATPYYRLVPFAAIDTDHIAEGRLDAIGDFLKLDTTDPDPSTYITALFDCSVSPLGVPISYLAEGSAGIPKGFNYLQTKDFDGPVYATIFPERAMTRYAATVPDGFLFFGKNRVKRTARTVDTSIIIRPGEGIALVGSAETATGATAVEVNGWNICEIIMDIEVLPLYAPELTLTGLQPNTEVRIFDAGTTTELAGSEDIDSGSFSWSYDYEAYSSVDISILSLGYQNIRLLGLPITFAGLTVPVQQQIDRQYENP